MDKKWYVVENIGVKLDGDNNESKNVWFVRSLTTYYFHSWFSRLFSHNILLPNIIRVVVIQILHTYKLDK